MKTIKLRLKIFFLTVGLLALLGAVLTLFVRMSLYKTLHAKLLQRGVSIAKNVTHAAITPLLTEQYAELELLIKDFKAAEDDIEYVYILNSQHEVVAHTFERGFPTELLAVNRPDPALPASIVHLASERGLIEDIAIPLLSGTAGSVHIGFSEQPITSGVRDIIASILWLMLAVILVGILISAALTTAVTRPIRDLVRALRAVENGDMAARAKVHADDEIGQLSRTFNRMVEARRRAEEELRKSEKSLRDITASLGEGVMVVDEGGRLVFINPEAERLLGWTSGELLGKEVHAIIHGRTREGLPFPAEDCPSLRVLRTGERTSIDDDVYTRRDGTMFPVAYITAPMTESGSTTASIIAFRDITQRKQNEADREQLILALQDALDNVKTLKGLMPICASCKRIRDDNGYWNQIETYLRDHSDAEFSHGICPECAERIYPEYYHKQRKSGP